MYHSSLVLSRLLIDVMGRLHWNFAVVNLLLGLMVNLKLIEVAILFFVFMEPHHQQQNFYCSQTKKYPASRY